MNTEGKIKLVLESIREQIDLSPKDSTIVLSQEKNDGLQQLSFDDYINILKKLENEYKIICIESLAEYKPSILTHSDPYDYRKDTTETKVLPTFDKFYTKYIKENARVFSSPKEANEKQELLRITYTKTREILMNDAFLLSKPESFGENEDLFEYLYNNPNKELKIKDIERELGRKFSKPISKILENLGFRKGLKDVFFRFGAGKIFFRNPSPTSDLIESRIRIPINVR
jgi:hypothetical protein